MRRPWLLLVAVGAFLLPACRYLPKWANDAAGDLVRVDDPVQVYFTTPHDPLRPGNPADKLAEAIDRTTRSIDVAAFELDNVVITSALARAVDRGVTVRIVTDTDYKSERGIELLASAGVPVVDDKRSALMHNKFLVLDGKAVWTGSMNFTENCAYKNNNHGILITSKPLAKSYATKFAWLFEDRKFGGKPRPDDAIPHPTVELADGTPVEVWFSTHDKPAKHVHEEIGKAQRSIHFLAFSFTDTTLGELLIEAANRGVEVKGVFETSQAGSQHSEFESLRAAGIPVFKDANPRNMHHKLIVIDGETVLGGSFNFSKSANDSNDENLVVIRSPAIAKRCEAEFRTVYDEAKAAAGRAD
jgi:phosphatidylserine/phosphatidylglycerophosphate/cardiolipin synthase-like enzyme